jgi:hypothetical protein
MDMLRTKIAEGLSHRAGLNAERNDFSSMTLSEVAKDCLRSAGVSLRGMGIDEVFHRALDTSDFQNILADVANKALLEGFEAAVETYDVWADTSGRVKDFKPHVFARASEAPSLVEVNPDGGEYAYGAMTDASETVTVVDYGIIVPFTRKAMINDDLGALSGLREKLGGAAKRKYGDLVYAVLTANAAMGDGINLFDATDHGNYITAGAAPAVPTLNIGAAAMAVQKDLQGSQNLNVRPEYILSPWALKGTVDNLTVTTNPAFVGGFTNDTATNYAVNPWSHLKPVYEARLDTFNPAGWFLAAAKGKTVRLFTLGENQEPYLDVRQGWNSDGIEFKCRVTAAAKAVDYRGLFYNDGAT